MHFRIIQNFKFFAVLTSLSFGMIGVMSGCDSGRVIDHGERERQLGGEESATERSGPTIYQMSHSPSLQGDYYFYVVNEASERSESYFTVSSLVRLDEGKLPRVRFKTVSGFVDFDFTCDVEVETTECTAWHFEVPPGSTERLSLPSAAFEIQLRRAGLFQLYEKNINGVYQPIAKYETYDLTFQLGQESGSYRIAKHRFDSDSSVIVFPPHVSGPVHVFPFHGASSWSDLEWVDLLVPIRSNHWRYFDLGPVTVSETEVTFDFLFDDVRTNAREVVSYRLERL